MADEDYSYYDHLKSHDILSILKALLDNGNYILRKSDGKLKARLVQVARETPWIHVRPMQGFDCGLWHQIIFNLISQVLPEKEKFVPRRCHQCWKVVVKPRTLQQLFNLLELEKKLDKPSKCGIETRDSVHGLYGGYFYNRSIEEGLERYEEVKQGLADNEVLKPLIDEVDADGRTTRIILKRGCTEFEHACGRSDKWEVSDGQNAIEDLVENFIAPENLNMTQPEHLIWNVKRRWIEFAWKNGDPTYSRYTAGKPLYPAYVTYHQAKIVVEDKKPKKKIKGGKK